MEAALWWMNGRRHFGKAPSGVALTATLRVTQLLISPAGLPSPKIAQERRDGWNDLRSTKVAERGSN